MEKGDFLKREGGKELEEEIINKRKVERDV